MDEMPSIAAETQISSIVWGKVIGMKGCASNGVAETFPVIKSLHLIFIC